MSEAANFTTELGKTPPSTEPDDLLVDTQENVCSGYLTRPLLGGQAGKERSWSPQWLVYMPQFITTSLYRLSEELAEAHVHTQAHRSTRMHTSPTTCMMT